MTLPIEIRDSPLGASFSVRIHPQASQTAITGAYDGALKLSVTAPPARGQANDAVAEFFAELFHRPRSAIQFLSGIHSRSKVIRIAGSTARELQLALQEPFKV